MGFGEHGGHLFVACLGIVTHCLLHPWQLECGWDGCAAWFTPDGHRDCARHFSCSHDFS